ncbi:MAG: methyltransferase [Novosphingobium sp.]
MRAWVSGTLVAVLITAPLVTAGATSFAILLSSTERPEADKVRDADRKPIELMAFGGVKAGSIVAELAPGGGYFTRLLSLAVGPKGHVYTVSNRPAAAVQEWAKTHPNTTEQSGQAFAKLAPVPVDVVWTSLNYHDFKNVKLGDSDAAARFSAQAFAALKPGGVYLINDHEAGVGTGATATSTLHRIESTLVIREVEAAGFKLDAQSNMLRHAGDNHALPQGDVPRGKTDQFVLRFKKPKGKG